MPTYSCFMCPSKDMSERLLSDTCPQCGREYRFPVAEPPTEIGEFRVEEALNRGFFAATYLCQVGRLDYPRVLRVAPIAVYELFEKDFAKECEEHRRLAPLSDHIVDIIDHFDADVWFGTDEIPCHVAVLQYIEGAPLAEFIGSVRGRQPETVAQIAIDLLTIWDFFRSRKIYHNDLHAYNIMVEELERGTRGPAQLDGSVRAVAVDLGSASSATLSQEGLLNDQHSVSVHLSEVLHRLGPGQDDPLLYRVISSLESITNVLRARPENVKLPTPTDWVDLIHNNMVRSGPAWREPLRLSSFDYGYNAYTLHPWHVPELLVDDDDRWLDSISTPGPQLVTGMRGCGKTMLLRALQFHARASRRGNEADSQIVQRIQTDSHVGLFASCTLLLPLPGQEMTRVRDSVFERLFVAFSVECARALEHLWDIDSRLVFPSYPAILYKAIGRLLETPTDLSAHGDVMTGPQLERFLTDTLISLDAGTPGYSLRVGQPFRAFEGLAEALRQCSPLWKDSVVLFLLDDVSTRYLPTEPIEELLKSLMLPSPVCAFKFTTEQQTLEMALPSLSGEGRSRLGRDYDIFDLGKAVYERTRGRSGVSFVERVLATRARYYRRHPPDLTPAEVLGDCSLKSIAQAIAEGPTESSGMYHGIRALAAVCVGDIGDVIRLYDRMLPKGREYGYPIPEDKQSDAYQDLCGLLVHDLDRREGLLKSFAVEFAEAAHELLVRSSKRIRTGEWSRPRLREYASIYVQLDEADTGELMTRLRQLVDAGVFVVHGAAKPREKDSCRASPQMQLRLTYRKLLGLSKLIGLGQSDRFELWGDTLRDYIEKPEMGRRILLDCEHAPEEPDEQEEEEVKEEAETLAPVPETGKRRDLDQPSLFVDDEAEAAETLIAKLSRKLTLDEVEPEQYDWSQVKSVVLGLGFEERSISAARFLLSAVQPEDILLVRYPEPGYQQEIMELANGSAASVRVVTYQEVLEGNTLPLRTLPTIVDATTLAKPLIFHAVRQLLGRDGAVPVYYAQAKSYYPTEEDVQPILSAMETRDYETVHEELGRIVTGEQGPFVPVLLLDNEADETRMRTLFTFASAKQDRLLQLLEARDYAVLEIGVPSGDSPRAKIARVVADLVGLRGSSANRTELGFEDMRRAIEFLELRVHYWYSRMGYNVELDVSGSKAQAIACGAVSVASWISKCWYVKAGAYEPRRYTRGTGPAVVYKIGLGANGSARQGEA